MIIVAKKEREKKRRHLLVPDNVFVSRATVITLETTTYIQCRASLPSSSPSCVCVRACVRACCVCSLSEHTVPVHTYTNGSRRWRWWANDGREDEDDDDDDDMHCPHQVDGWREGQAREGEDGDVYM